MTRFAVFFWATALVAQTGFFPLAEIKPGMRGIGKTIFAGSEITEFQVEILGVLENAGPKQNIILARLSGGPLSESGVLQGMSGSPVYIGGRLVGAVALGFAFSKEPIAGIRPIEEMVKLALPPRRASLELPARRIAAGSAELVELATPISFAGFTAGTLRQFEPQLTALGLQPLQGALAGRSPQRGVNPKPLEPGGMISVHLITGDFNVAADGTVTHIDGDRVFAFGHRFLSIGTTELPFSRSEVLTLLPNLNTSFKISAARELRGAITADYSAAVAGQIGRDANTVPATLRVNGANPLSYVFQIARDRLLTPFLLQMAVFSAIDATERTAGASTVAVSGKIEFEKAPPVIIDNVYASDNGALLPASLAGSVPLSYAMNSGFPELRVRDIDMKIDVQPDSRMYRVDSIWASPAAARPGDLVQIQILLNGPGSREMRRAVNWRVPVGAKKETLQLTVSDAFTTNMTDYGFILNDPPHTLTQVLEVLNGLRPNSNMTLRISRPEAGFVVHGHPMPDPPPSIALLLKRNPAVAAPSATSKIAEFNLNIPGIAVSGSKTVPLEIKE